MKAQLQKLFSPILNRFESGDEVYQYRRSHRIILIVVSLLFLMLSLASLAAALYTGLAGAWLPFLVFFLVGVVSGIVGFLGSDQAVARIWGNK